MKHLYIILLSAIAIIASSMSSQAWAQRKLDPEQEAKLFNAKMKMMQERLELTDDQLEKLIPVYKNYTTELEQIFRSRKHNRRYKPSTAAEASQVMIEQLDIDARVIDLQKRYIVEFAKILNPDQVMKIYRVEGEIQREIWKEKRRRHQQQANCVPNCYPPVCPAA